MRMSAKAEYAVRAMVELAAAEAGVLVKTEDLAKAQGIPPQFLVDILTNLRTDRLVRSHRGRDGGYELARERRKITAGDIARAAMQEAIEEGLGPEPQSRLVDEVIGPEVAQASAAFLAALDTVTVEELCRRAQAKSVFGDPDARSDFTI